MILINLGGGHDEGTSGDRARPAYPYHDRHRGSRPHAPTWLAGPSIDDVLAASGKGNPQLYHYFEGRQDLAAAVLYRQFDRVMETQPALHDPACADLRVWRDQVLAAHRRSGYGMCPLGAFVGQVDDEPELRTILAELFARWAGSLAGLVERARDQGRVRSDIDPEDAGQMLLAALEGGTILAHFIGNSPPSSAPLTRRSWY